MQHMRTASLIQGDSSCYGIRKSHCRGPGGALGSMDGMMQSTLQKNLKSPESNRRKNEKNQKDPFFDDFNGKVI